MDVCGVSRDVLGYPRLSYPRISWKVVYICKVPIYQMYRGEINSGRKDKVGWRLVPFLLKTRSSLAPAILELGLRTRRLAWEILRTQNKNA